MGGCDVRRDSRGAKSREGRAEKPTTTFLGSTTQRPHPGSPFFSSFLPPRVPSPVPSLSLPLSPRPSSHLASILVLLCSSPTSSRRARGGVVERTEPPLAARSRRTRHGCSLLQALRLLVASPLQIADAWFAPTAHCASLGFSMFLPLSGCVVRFCCWGRRRPAFGAGAFCFCCVFSGVFVVRLRGFRGSVRWRWSRRSRSNSLRPAPIHPADLFGRARAIRILFCSGRLSLISTRFSARFDEFGCSREILGFNRVWFPAFLRIIS
jgi:hypothetical protein